MAISNKLKSLLKLKGKSQAELASHIGINLQSLHNKFYRNSFSVDDLIKTAEFLDCELAFIVNERHRVPLDADDIKEN